MIVVLNFNKTVQSGAQLKLLSRYYNFFTKFCNHNKILDTFVLEFFLLTFWCQIALVKIIWLKNGRKMSKKFGRNCPKNFKLKKNLEWNRQIVDENQIIDMYYIQMWSFLSNMWMNVEIWSTTITFYIATLALLKKLKKMSWFVCKLIVF